MRLSNPTLSHPGFIAMGIQMAQSTFSDVMPLFQNADRPVFAPKRVAAPAPAPAGKSWTSAVADWFYRHQVAEREAYLAKSTDIYDLERRMCDFDRRPYL
jgi:hypothetical protein